jgi:hypothetical protein
VETTPSRALDVALACELLARMQMLALTGKARRWEPKRLRLRAEHPFGGGGGMADRGLQSIRLTAPLFPLTERCGPPQRQSVNLELVRG